MVEIYSQRDVVETNDSGLDDLQTQVVDNQLNNVSAKVEAMNESLKEIMKDYFEKNISVNGKKVDFSDKDMAFDLVEDPKNEKKFYLVFQNKFDGLGLQSDKKLKAGIAFDVIPEKNNYYVKFDTKNSSFDKSISVDGQELLVGDVIYDLNAPKEKQKTTDIRIEANITKTKERIRKKVEGLDFESFTNIKEKAEFENTQLTGLNNLSLGKEITKESEGYSRTIYLFDSERAQYLPVSKAYFDKLGNFDPVKTLKEYQEQSKTKPLKVLGQVLNLDMGLSKDKKTLQAKFDKDSIDKLETRVKTHREKLISYIDRAKVAPGSQFNEFDKIDKERPWHKGVKKFLFDTANMKLDIMNDTYTLDSSRKDDQDIRFGFDFANKPIDDKIFIKDLKGKKISAQIETNKKGIITKVKDAFDINIDENNIYSVFDYNGELTIYKSDKAIEKTGTSYPELAGEGAKYIKKETLRYYNDDNKEMEYYDDKEGRKIMDIPATVNDKSQWKLDKVSENIYTDYLIDMKKFDATKLQKSNLNEEDMKNTFLALMQKEDIKLQGRGAVKILVDSKTGKYEYYKAKQGVTGEAIVLEKDKELYDTAEKVMDLMKKRLEIINKIENVQLRWTNKGKDERFEGAVGGGRGLEKSSISTSNKLSFLNGSSNIISQEILWGRGESTIVDYKIKKDGNFVFDVKDSKAVKLQGTWFLKRRLNPKLDIQNYKMSFEPGSTFKLKFDPVE
ncbi:hypothetical protein K9M48_01665 [Candidatus Gracilibacteria bacterium]|nr:hypothetical protein [Candidatus Gracilibacteria bacterium]